MAYKIWLLVPSVGLAVLAGCGSPSGTATPASPQAQPSSPAASAGPTKVHASYVSLTPSQSGVWAAKEAGLFAKYGLDVDLTYIQGSPAVTAALLAGDIATSVIAGPAIVNADKHGADLVFVAGIVTSPQFRLVADPSIKTIADLKGKTIGVSTLNGSVEFILKKVLATHGLNLGTDVKAVPGHDAPGQLALFASKQVQAGFFGTPDDLEARKQGGVVLLDTTGQFPYMSLGLAARKTYVQANRPVLLSFLKAEIDGVRRFKSDENFAESILTKYLKTTDPEILKATWQDYRKAYDDIPHPDPRGIQEILDETGADGHTAAEFVDDSLVKELQDRGFFTTSPSR